LLRTDLSSPPEVYISLTTQHIIISVF
jgi:hypothetical protein